MALWNWVGDSSVYETTQTIMLCEGFKLPYWIGAATSHTITKLFIKGTSWWKEVKRVIMKNPQDYLYSSDQILIRALHESLSQHHSVFWYALFIFTGHMLSHRVHSAQSQIRPNKKNHFTAACEPPVVFVLWHLFTTMKVSLGVYALPFTSGALFDNRD